MAEIVKKPLSTMRKYFFLGVTIFFAVAFIAANISESDDPGKILGIAVAPLFWALIGVSIFRLIRKDKPMRSFEDQVIITSFWLTIITLLQRASSVSSQL